MCFPLSHQQRALLPRRHCRSHGRRALYLTVLSQALAAHEAFAKQQLSAVDGDPTRPALLIHLSAGRGASAAAGAGAGLSLRLLLTLPSDAFPLAKLAPGRNNVRWAGAPAAAQPAAANGVAAGKQGPAGGAAAPAAAAAAAAAQAMPTPHYNASLMADMLAVEHAQQLAAAVTAMPGLRDGVLLLKVGGAHPFAPRL